MAGSHDTAFVVHNDHPSTPLPHPGYEEKKTNEQIVRYKLNYFVDTNILVAGSHDTAFVVNKIRFIKCL